MLTRLVLYPLGWLLGWVLLVALGIRDLIWGDLDG